MVSTGHLRKPELGAYAKGASIRLTDAAPCVNGSLQMARRSHVTLYDLGFRGIADRVQLYPKG